MRCSKKNEKYCGDFYSIVLYCLPVWTVALPVVENRIVQKLQQVFLS